ncbi:hypothetical protein F5J12DRAFT_374228 [Pisolithus orientalis]|uniref:uncharacterized protein n=1 Tax=Pisolithus orientalis TaxID=936130 RepID=UPI0022253E59|nr:uncharacterized protein F5J12DRAFT_374228 [Pisolithus orientalis]KAI6028335.1 hypothetical protein F5J12DRAFT_374228 [Pisolithus orientalis]
MTTWNKPCPNQSINHVVQDSETNAARDLHFHRLLLDYMVDVGNAQAITHPTPSTTAPPSAATTAIAAGNNITMIGSGSLPTGWRRGTLQRVDCIVSTTVLARQPDYTLVGKLLFVTRTPIFCCLSPLSSGWEMRLTSTTYRVYFVDHNTKITTWDYPRLPSLMQMFP